MAVRHLSMVIYFIFLITVPHSTRKKKIIVSHQNYVLIFIVVINMQLILIYRYVIISLLSTERET